MRAAWRSFFEPLKTRLRGAMPRRDSPEELSALTTFASGIWGVLRAHGPSSLSQLIHAASQRDLEAMVRREGDRTPTERKLALRYLQQAFAVLDAARAQAVPSAEAIAKLENELVEDAHVAFALAALQHSFPRSMLSLELYAFVAFDLLEEGTTDELVAWALRARAVATDLEGLRSRVPQVDAEAMPSATIMLSAEEHEAFEALLESPPEPSDRLRRLLSRGAS